MGLAPQGLIGQAFIMSGSFFYSFINSPLFQVRACVRVCLPPPVRTPAECGTHADAMPQGTSPAAAPKTASQKKEKEK